MPSGKRRRALPDAPGAVAAAFVFVLAVSAVSCGAGSPFDRSLAALDGALGFIAEATAVPDASPLPYGAAASPGTAAGTDGGSARVSDPEKLGRLLDAASRRAKSSSDWLRLFPRAFLASERASEPRLAADIADKARKAYPGYEHIALAACRAYLDAGRSADALALFPVPLDPGERGPWFAEAFLAEYGKAGRGFPGAGDVDALLKVAEASGRGEPALDAALLRMGAGDHSGAAWCLRRALELGAAPEPDLAWDAGVPDALLSDPLGASDGRSLERRADAAALLGERDWAREYLLDLVRGNPGYSWKAYAALASLAEDRRDADFWYDRMAEAFPADSGALRARAAYLARTGRGDEALAVLSAAGGETDPRTAVLAAEIRLRLRPEESRAVAAVRLANAFPDDPYVQTWALGRLAAAERFPEASEAYRQAKARGLDLGRPWYFEALPLILEGRRAEAAALIERDGPAEGRPEASFALGVLYARAGNHALAAERFRIAASLASEPEGKARALTELGKSLAASGDREGARAVWAAALALSPDNAEVLRLLAGR